jgi:haloalkane dehalogenase
MGYFRRRHADYRAAVDSRRTPYPVQVVWGAKDPILPLRRHGWRASEAAHVAAVSALPASHYLQAEQAPTITELVVDLTARAWGARLAPSGPGVDDARP